jgi:hypothetical protein
MMLVGVVADYGCRADDQEASQVAVALLRYAAERCWRGTSPIQAASSRSNLKAPVR